MNWEQRTIRLCAAALVWAVVLRLGTMGFFDPLPGLLQNPEALSFFLYLQTGRVVRLPEEPPSQPVELTEPEPTAQAPSLPHFTAEEAAAIPITDPCGHDPDLAALLTSPLDWDLTGADPAVLILHTHATESYTKSGSDDYAESSPYRTLDPDHNMLCLGRLVAARLEEAGIRCIHDTTLHDYPSYNDSYSNAAAATEQLLAQYPSIRLVLDLHRDAADTPYGQMVTQCSIGSETAAQLMMVVGTDGSGLHHPKWEENLALALKLQTLLERENPGICRNVNLSRNRYNQQLGDHALLIEIGAAGNTLDEACLAAEKLARAIIALRHGTE